MLSIDDSRRVSGYVRQKAREWLFEHMSDYCTDADEASRTFCASIMADGKITEEEYNRFFSFFDNNPFSARMIHTGEKQRGVNVITSEKLECYFVTYNGLVMPMGFIIGFFEDDYRTEGEKERLFRRFLDNARSETVTEWNRIRFESNERLMLAHRRMQFIHNINLPSSFTKAFMSLICVIYALVQTVIFAVRYRFFQVLAAFVTGGLHIKGVCNIPVARLGLEQYTFLEYLRASSVMLVANTLIFIVAFILIFARILPALRYLYRCGKARSALSKRRKFVRTIDGGDKAVSDLCDEAARAFMSDPEHILSVQVGHPGDARLMSRFRDLKDFDYSRIELSENGRYISVLCIITVLAVCLVAILIDNIDIISFIKRII